VAVRTSAAVTGGAGVGSSVSRRSADEQGMGHTRDKRRDKKRSDPKARQEAAKVDLRRRVRKVFENIGLLHLFDKVPAKFRDRFLDSCYPDPALVFDDSFPAADAFGGAYAAVRAEVKSRFPLAGIRITIPDPDFDLPPFVLTVRDFYTIVWPLALNLRLALEQADSDFTYSPGVTAHFRTFLESAAPWMEYLNDDCILDQIVNALAQELIVPLVSRGRTDTRLLYPVLTWADTQRGPRLIVTLRSTVPPTKRVRLRNATDDTARPMYRFGGPTLWDEVVWVDWKASEIDDRWAAELGIGPGDAWPVYVQSHALKQLRARLDVHAHADFAEHWLFHSLLKPKIVQRVGGDELLVAFEVADKRIGYLVVSVRDGLVAVRTFLFLTMAQTPEGRLLKERLRLTQDELSYLRLHELSRFTQTDLKDDPQLRKLLTECGCGQLFEVAEAEDALKPDRLPVKPFAAELRRYVGWAA
jgi:hypothetical protein